MPGTTLSSLDGSTFVVCQRDGNLEASPSDVAGFFFKDTRHLSRWVLTVDGKRPDVLSADSVEYYFTQFFLAPATGSIYRNPYLSVIRRRYLGGGFVEDLSIENHGREAVELDVRLAAGCDFADLFEVKDQLAKRGKLYRETRDGALVLGYVREDFRRETELRSSEPAEIDDEGFRFRLRLEPKTKWRTLIEVRPAADGKLEELKFQTRGANVGTHAVRENVTGWIADAPKMESSPDAVRRICAKSLVDLAALRFHVMGGSLPAAGLPWFMALFGRDSVLTSYQSLHVAPVLARTTLEVLAGAQAKEHDEFRDAEPGKILHELRFGELTHFGEWPQAPYFGSADVTPLYLVLLDEYERWSGDAALVRRLEPNARAALEWIDRYGDRDGDGYVEYERRRPTGLDNQCWKDSWNSILFADGTVAPTPRATCEIQGYVYDAKMRCARLAREIWHDEKLAQRLLAEAAELKRRFNQDFWIPEREFFALALDGQKRKVDSLTSNVGHLLWSGIVDDDKIAPLVRHLMGPRLFSGWGIRTMAEGEGGYNPIEYHDGTVWPHDTSLVAAGLARCGYREEASFLCARLYVAATFFDDRLPEVFAGYSADATVFPVQYPTASSPQAWATGAPLLALRVMLGLEPKGEELTSNPVLPKVVSQISLQGIPGRWGRADISVHNPHAVRPNEIVSTFLGMRARMVEPPAEHVH